MTTPLEALQLIAALHSRDPESGMDYTDAGYTDMEDVCLICGTSDEYGVLWPCRTRLLADEGIKGLA